MMSSQNTAFKETEATFVIAQFTPDLFRREPKNIGVVVEKGGFVAARFVGEAPDTEGGWDLRTLKWMPNPNAYRLWVDRWRKIISSRAADWQASLISENAGNFSAVRGGELLGTGSDTPHEVCDYLFGLLVSAGGLADAIPGAAQAESQFALRNDIRSVFRENGLFDAMFLRHPVYTDRLVKGTSSWHRVAFYQQADHEAWAMEPIDFCQAHKNIARDHAAYTRWVFDDFHRQSATNGLNINTIAIVRYEKDNAELESVSKGLEILGNQHRIVNWLDPGAARAFVDERLTVASAVEV